MASHAKPVRAAVEACVGNVPAGTGLFAGTHSLQAHASTGIATEYCLLATLAVMSRLYANLLLTLLHMYGLLSYYKVYVFAAIDSDFHNGSLEHRLRTRPSPTSAAMDV